MNTRCLDVLLINPDSSTKAYQQLAKTYSAIEPPTWALLLAESCRSKGFGAAILDCDAERLSLEESVTRVELAKARLVLLVVYGQNPNSGTTSMIGATALARAIKDSDQSTIIAIVGSHVSALPLEILSEGAFDIVLLNEGVYALHDLLRSNLDSDLEKIKGIGFRRKNLVGDPVPALNAPQRVVPQERMDVDLPGYAWDLLPYRSRPLDLYRAHFWHAGFDHNKRTPFAAIYTSLGCRFGCEFCMINIINRTDNSPDVSAAESRGMRFWSPEWVAREMKKLADLGVTALRISDEMFFLDRRYYVPVLQNAIDQQFGFNMWTYSRVDTVRQDQLERFKQAGVNWLALGVEAGNTVVRQEVSKGSFKEVNIRDVSGQIRAGGIHVISNYIFGLPQDTYETMQETLNLALELNTEMANMYPCQALPGSPLYRVAKQKGWALPNSYEGYAFLSYEAQPLPTENLSAADVLRFRDQAWQKYFTNPDYLALVEKTFGYEQRQNVVDMSAVTLRRKLLEEPESP